MLCGRIATAVSELQDEYRGKIILRVVQVNDSNRDLMKEHMDPESHGMLAFDPDGKIVDKIIGHKFGKKEIVALLTRLSN
ncbi:MAG: hypothetical protein V3W41_15100 [Planctomycetota bacterium]